MPGPMPKDPGVRQRRNKASTRALLRTDEAPRMRAPSLPAITKKRKRKVGGVTVEVEEVQEWHPMARRFWELVWSSPMTAEFVRADEPALFRLVFLVDLFWKRGSLAVATEIRMLEREFGLTPLSRRRLEWTVVQAEEAKDRHEERRIKRAEVIDVDPRGVLDA
jgi:hypothetical protein